MSAKKRAPAKRASAKEPTGTKRVAAFKSSADEVRQNLAPGQTTIDCAECGTPNVPTLVQPDAYAGLPNAGSQHAGKRIICCGCNGKTVVVT